MCGCGRGAGIGGECWTSAFYVQEGVDPDAWPGVFKEIVLEVWRKREG